MLIEYIFYIALGYLSGSLMFGYAVPKLIKGIDVRKESSGKSGNCQRISLWWSFVRNFSFARRYFEGIIARIHGRKTFGNRVYGLCAYYGSAGIWPCFSLSRRKEKRRKGNCGFLWSAYWFISVLDKFVAFDFLVSAVFCGYSD